MDDLTKAWSCLTLTDQEGDDLRLKEEEAAPEFSLAAKFFTKRVLNIEAIAKTFNPIWRSKNRFKVKKEDDHFVLFTFDNQQEMDKILASEPWSFDKHLVVLQRYEKDVDLCDMNFNMINFWVQVHEIPVRFRTQKIAEKICETIGTVSRPADNTKVEGDGFIRVRVKVDISKPLCRGRVISLENGRELWVSFKYERLPNLCYWCGCLTHADKDYDLWIDSEGTLPLETQQYGPWIRAQPFTRTRMNVVVVPGFYSKKSNSTKAAPSNQSRKPPVVVVRKGGPSPEIVRPEKERNEQSGTTDSAPDIQGEDPLLPNQTPTVQLYPNIADPVFMAEKKSDELFEEQIQEIDRELGKFDANREISRDKQGENNKENNLEFLTINEGVSHTKVYSRAHNFPPLKCCPSSALTDISNSPELNTRRWKRVNRAEIESDIVMEDAVGEKRSGRKEDQPELLKKRKKVSQVDGVVTNILAKVGSQPRQNQ